MDRGNKCNFVKFRRSPYFDNMKILMMGLLGFFMHRVNASNVQFTVKRDLIAKEIDSAQEVLPKEKYWSYQEDFLPIVINTWSFSNATSKAWEVLTNNGTSLDAVEQGCSVCEEEQCDGTVGYGGSPDENGETTLDAMIMDGPSHKSGAVAGLRRIKHAISVARKVLDHTEHTLIIGEWATQFALEMGFKEENLQTVESLQMWKVWKDKACQPNFWRNNVTPNPKTNCGPYSPVTEYPDPKKDIKNVEDMPHGHDTISMVVIDASGTMACGTSTNGARHKIPGRVGDAPITGSGSYVDQEIGGAAATGDGDVLMRFLPSLTAVEYMRNGMTPSTAASYSLKRIANFYPNFEGAVVAVKANGEFGAACHGFPKFTYSVVNPDLKTPQVFTIECNA